MNSRAATLRAARRLLLELGDERAVTRLSPGEASERSGEPEDAILPLLKTDETPETRAARQKLEKVSGRVVGLVDPEYPALLREIPDPPPVLFIRGCPLSLAPAVALVGSRVATRQALEVTRRLASGLARAGVTVVSGFARGVDGMAHKSVIEKEGCTIAVLGCGIDVCYPPEHEKMLTQMLEKGAVLSEFPPGTPPKPFHFPVRNRILAGLSRMVVVVEAREKSGSLITARLAGEFGRDVGAVPGSVLLSETEGSNGLLKDGAILVRNENDILAELGSFSRSRTASATFNPQEQVLAPQLDPDAALVFSRLDETEPKDADTLMAATGLPVARLASALVALELEGLVSPLPGAVFVRRREKS